MPPTAKDKDYTLALGWAWWFGLGLLVVGSSSLRSSILLAAPVVLNDPDPNPVSLGILAAFSFWQRC